MSEQGAKQKERTIRKYLQDIESEAATKKGNMAFDAMHVIWTTHNFSPPNAERDDWQKLKETYEQIEQENGYCEMSSALSSPVSNGVNDATFLTLSEQNRVENYLIELMAFDGDRIAGKLPLACCAVNASAVHLLFVPALSSHNQIIGRLKSKTASYILRSSERQGQTHLWSKGYWFANVNGTRAIEKIKQLIRSEHCE